MTWSIAEHSTACGGGLSALIPPSWALTDDKLHKTGPVYEQTREEKKAVSSKVAINEPQ